MGEAMAGPFDERPAIAQATLADADDIVALMDAAQDPGGAGLSQRMPPELVRRFLGTMPCIVARRGGALVGALLAQPKPDGDEAGPVTRAMLDAYPGGEKAYVYGPIVVAAEARGRGLAQAMACALVRALPNREGILFIGAGNEASLRAHAKMGARTVARFYWEGREFLVLTLGGE
jgi:predicted GNAT superfamily acetyltransferase